MSTILASSLVSRSGTLIQDKTKIRWPEAELLDWLNDGQREVVLLKPEACVTNGPVLLQAGKTKQTLPATGIILLDLVRNMGAAGSTPGQAITICSREVLDQVIPEWHSVANDLGYIQHYTFDPRDPKTYYTYPKAPATSWYVDLVFSSAPANATEGSVISIDDIYSNALLDYMLYRCYSKDATFAQNATLAAAHYQLFLNSLGGKGAVESATNPNKLGNSAGNPNIPVRAA